MDKPNILVDTVIDGTLNHLTLFAQVDVSIHNIGIGIDALQNNTGALSVGIGTGALQNNTGAESSGFGTSALNDNTGDNSSGFGANALVNNTGDDSNGFGTSALGNNVTGNSNGFGNNALLNNAGANSNGFGNNALMSNTGINSNGFGNNAVLSNGGDNSNGFGNNALQYVANTANDLTAIGHNAAEGTIGVPLNFVNSTAIGANSTITASNQVTLGDINTTDVITTGDITASGMGIFGNNLDITAISNHIVMKESDNGDKRWDTHVNENNYKITENGVADRLIIDTNGNLTAPPAPVIGNHLANKTYVDNAVSNIVGLTGLSAAPGSATAGDIYYDTTTNKHRGYNGSIWNDMY